jgi:hypothetical protein
VKLWYLCFSTHSARLLASRTGAARQREDLSQNWRTFVRNHAQSIVACDFLVVVTARFRTLYVFLLMEVGTRRIVHCHVTHIQRQPGPCSSFAKRFRAIILTVS